MTRAPLAFAILSLLAACGPAPAPAPAEAPPSFSAPVAEESVAPPSAAPVQAASAKPAAAAPSVKAAAAPADPNAAKLAALPAPYNGADYANGQKVFAQCRACHVIEAGGGNRVGPNLHGVYGRAAGAVADFAYSPAVKDSGVTWTAAELDKYLAAPAAAIPGNRMTFMGVRKPEDRRDVIGYLAIESKK